MDAHTLAVLEFSRVREETAEYCLSPQGASQLASQEVGTEGVLIDAVLDRVGALRTAMESGSVMPAMDFPEIGPFTARLSKPGAVLEGEEFAAIGRYILSSMKLKRFLSKASSDPLVTGLTDPIPDLSAVSQRIFRTVDPEGVLKERQIPALVEIRGRIRRISTELEKAARSCLEDPGTRTYWQADTVTQRDGRVVLPLKAQHKGKIRGIVHEVSASGATVFVEPLEILERNNALVEQENLYRMEVQKVLRELASEVARRLPEILAASEAVTRLDCLLSRARYAILHHCVRAERSAAGLVLRAARHPLLRGAVVPVDLALDADCRMLIVTGPNTGGKTVTLKTIGLLCLMNQFGMQIPAGEGTALPVHDGIFVDIGDEQSIEQSLSTFSAHVRNLADIVRRGTPRSLVLLDELGAGTDPQEGVAIAMALLDHFRDLGCLLFATTHHGILKNYGYTRAGVQNASMGFDSRTLTPTYRILVGVPGESRALEIAARQGVPGSILETARGYLDGERTDLSKLVQTLSEKQRTLAQREEEHREKETDLREKRRSTDLKELILKQKERDLRRQGLKDLRDFLSESRKEFERVVRGLREGTLTPASAGQILSEVEKRLAAEEQAVRDLDEALVPEDAPDLSAGMEVLFRRTGKRGRVVRKDKGKRWIVELDNLRISILASDVLPAPELPPSAANAFTVETAGTEAGDRPVLQLDLRGERLEEALKRLDRQIDAALVYGLHEFGVIHGKGEGVLQTGIREHLGNLRFVEEFRFALPEDGGAGKTIVRLRS